MRKLLLAAATAAVSLTPAAHAVGQGDYAKLIRSLGRAFSGTAQPVPGTEGVTVWYLETGFQSSVAPDKA